MRIGCSNKVLWRNNLPPYQAIFSKMSYGESQMLDKAFYEEDVRRLCLAFE
ncbi:hypothetical protein YC2023_035145 [Brassica napus]